MANSLRDQLAFLRDEQMALARLQAEKEEQEKARRRQEREALQQSKAQKKKEKKKNVASVSSDDSGAHIELAAGLPVSERGQEVIDTIRKHRVVIVCGETGSGKTTQLPKICLLAGRGKKGLIAHTQPRRIAASSIAKRLAEETKTELGQFVGYKVRFTDKTQSSAKIKLMTDGILLAETQNDPLLKAYDTIIIDEAHERSINIDFLLGYLKGLLKKRPDLKVIVTSATIDSERFAEHFADDSGHPAPVLNISGRTYPVEVRYQPIEESDETDDKSLMMAINDACDELGREGPGDILVFLPGEREIREAAEYLRRMQPPTTQILMLFARLSADEQERVFRTSGSRRIVLSTNVAETSITVPGIRYVVDTGLARVKRYSYRNKVDQLLIEPISQASANQRSGRCGRVADGICIRLYSEEEFARRAPFTDPEIMRTNLASVILRMKALRLGDIRKFAFVQAPPQRAIVDGVSLLKELNALDDEERLTQIGRSLSKLPVDPKVARMLLAANDHQALNEVLIIASALSVQDPRERPIESQEAADTTHKAMADDKSDFLTFVKLWRYVETATAKKESNRKLTEEFKRKFLSPRRLREWKDVYKQLKDMTVELGWRLNTVDATYEQIHISLLTGLLGNIGYKQPDDNPKAPPFIGARSIKFHIWPGSPRVKKCGRWIMAAELVETSRLFARTVADIDPKWVEKVGAHLIKKSYTEPHWEKNQASVMALERGTLYGLTIYAQRRVNFTDKDPVLARELFIREALVGGDFDCQASFFKHNQNLIREIRNLEHKSRRLDVLVDDALIEQFYDKLIPADVVSGVTFEQWRKAAEKTQPKLLYLSKDELMRHEASGITTQYFPKNLAMRGVEMALTYHFEPGSPRDGVTLAVPLYALNMVDETAVEWLVPGMLKEKVQLLVKSLPQKYRRHCVPLPEYAKNFALRHEAKFAQAGLREAIIEDLREQFQIAPNVVDFKLEMLPAHLTMNFKVLDEYGRQIAMGRNLASLRSELGQEAQKSFQAVAAKEVEVSCEWESEITSWSFGELPEIMEIKRKNQSLIGHPALVDRGEYCTLEVFDDMDQAQKNHERGLIRLFKLSLREQIRFIEKSLKTLQKIQMQAAMVPSLSKAFESFEAMQEAVIDATLQQTALQEPWPMNEMDFEKRRNDAKGRLNLIAQEISRLLSEIVELAIQVPRKLKQCPDKRVIEDIQSQMAALFVKDFLLSVGYEHLIHYPRYLKAIIQRLEKWQDDQMKDAEKMRDVGRFVTLYEREVARRKGVVDERLIQFRWLIEELRVSLFAQKLRTPMPVSIKRLDKVWNSILY